MTDPRGNTSTSHYDSEGRVTEVVDAAGNQTLNDYDSNSNVIKFTDALAKFSTAAFDSDSRQTDGKAPTGMNFSFSYVPQSATKGPAYYYPTSFRSPQGNSTDLRYDAKGNMASALDRATEKGVELAYNPNGTVASAKDANGNTTSYAYDAKGNLTEVTPPAPLGATNMTYDSLSRVATKTDGRGQTASYSYDELDRVTKVTFEDGASVSYGHDPNGNRTERIDSTGTTTYSYDELNRQTRKAAPEGTISYGYDAAGNMTSHDDWLGTVSYDYNSLNLLTSLTEPGGHQTTFAYDKSYNRTNTSYPNGVEQDASYDASGRIATIVGRNADGQTLTSFTYNYKDAESSDRALRQSVTDNTSGEKTTYGYDSLDRLTRALIETGATAVKDYRYSFDPAGNRTREQELVSGSDISASYNAANELVSRQGLSYTHDANGNMTGHSGGRSFGYNAADQTTSAQAPGMTASERWTFAGEGQAERVKAETPADGDFSYQTGLLGRGGLAGTNGFKEQYVRDPAGTPVALRHADGERGYYLFDSLGSIAAVTQEDGTVGVRYRYDPYGNERDTTGSLSNRLRFAGQYFDSLGHYHMGTRLYLPAIGRWQQDPLDQTGDLYEGNRYVYAGGDPVNLTDPTGMHSCGFLAGVCDTANDFAGDVQRVYNDVNKTRLGRAAGRCLIVGGAGAAGGARLGGLKGAAIGGGAGCAVGVLSGRGRR